MISPTSNPNVPEVIQQLSPNSSHSNRSRHGSISLSHPQSPNQTSQQQVPTPFAAAAANARRERKVLDLEISNSSLLAINRQLEREVRRQKTELRRFRRLSRAGRLTSLGSMMMPESDDHESLELDQELDDPNGPLSDSDDDDDDPDSSISGESLASTNISGAEFNRRDAARLEKDEKRLQLDLNKHRQLLVDSQKMNQSLKRCMAISEEMIAEGRRALEYRVSFTFVYLFRIRID
jgi:hypothetical protein